MSIIKVTLEDGVKYVINSSGTEMCERMYPGAKVELIHGELVNASTYDDSKSKIFNDICHALNIPVAELASKSRGPKSNTLKRKAVCYHLRERGWPLSEIGEMINRDHTSVMMADRGARELMNSYSGQRDRAEFIRNLNALIEAGIEVEND